MCHLLHARQFGADDVSSRWTGHLRRKPGLSKGGCGRWAWPWGPSFARPALFAALLLILWSRDASPAPGARPLPSRHVSAGSSYTQLPSRSHLSASSNSGHTQRRSGGFSGTAQLTPHSHRRARLCQTASRQVPEEPRLSEACRPGQARQRGSQAPRTRCPGRLEKLWTT